MIIKSFQKETFRFLSTYTVYLQIPDEYRMTLKSIQITKIFFLNPKERRTCNLDKTGTHSDSSPH